MRNKVRTRFAATALTVAVVAVTGCSSSSGGKPAAAPSAPAVRTVTPIPASALPASHPTVWMCRPGMADNPCEGGLDDTAVSATGATTTQPFTPARTPPVDCFYVYPTASQAPSVNSPYRTEPTTLNTTRAQVGRFAQDCRLYVPVYRQLTATALLKPGSLTPAATKLATDDVLSAWNDYLAHDNKGRGVVLIGHSQGSGQLINLIRTQIDTNPAERALLVSALVIGGNVQVPVGKDVGGDFRNVPACRQASQFGCVVAYSSYAGTPPANASFGRVGPGTLDLSGTAGSGAGRQVLCTNPGALAGGSAAMQTYLPTRSLGKAGLPGIPNDILPDYPTGFASYPGLIKAACRYENGVSWLDVALTPATGDTRKLPSSPLPASFGLHLVDVNIALGNLVTLVGDQARAWAAAS